MKDRRTGPRPDRLFVDSTITGDVEVVTMSTKPGDLGPPIVRQPITEADLWETSGVLNASAIPFDPPGTVKVDAVFVDGRKVWGAPVPELSPAEELQRDDEPLPAVTKTERGLLIVAVVIATVSLSALFWPVITRSPLA